MTANYGSDVSQWPSAGSMLAANLTLRQAFVSGGNPLDSATWLQETLQHTAQGMFLELEHAAGRNISSATENRLDGAVEQSGFAAVCGGDDGFNLCRRQPGRLLPGDAIAPVKIYMRQVMKTILLAAAVVFSLMPSAWAYSLGGPIGNAGDSYQVPVIGYGLPGDVNAPKNLGEEYRRNTPVLYYACDATFLDYFGSNGVAAVDSAYILINSAFTNNQTGMVNGLDGYSANLTEFPLDSRHVNYQAQALALMDVKTQTLGLMIEQLGLADPVRYTWTLHDRKHTGNIPCPVGQEYLVEQRNFDYFSTPLNQLQYSPYVNDTLYTYLIEEFCIPPNPLAVAVPYSVDPLADIYSPVASYVSGNAIMGDYFTGLTRDDVAGLRYMLQKNNINWETPSADSLLLTINTNFNLQQLFPAVAGTNGVGTNTVFYYFDGTFGYGDLRTLLATSITNNPATLQALYPGLVIATATNYFVLASNATVNAYFVAPIGSPYGSVQLVVVTNYTPYLQERWGYTFANLFTNHYYSKSVSYLQSITVAPANGSPYGTPSTTNAVTQALVNTNLPSGDFFVLTPFGTNVCPFDILYTGLTNVTAVTNFITSASTNVVINTNVVTSSNSYAFSQVLITYFTNYTFVINPVTCSTVTNGPGLYQGIEKIQFVGSKFDSTLGQLYQPITNYYTLVLVTNSQAVVQHFQRIVTAPDILLAAADLASTPADPGFGVPFGARNLNFDTANVLPQLAGPGTITTPTLITYDKVGPVFYNGTATTLDVLDGTPYFTETPGGDVNDTFYIAYFVWGSFDGTTNAPVVYPNGTSIDALQNEILIQVTPTTVPDGYSDGSQYPPVTFTATGGSFEPPYTWSATGLPAGFSISSGGTLSGATTQPGNYIFTLTLTDSLSRSVQWRYPLKIQ